MHSLFPYCFNLLHELSTNSNPFVLYKSQSVTKDISTTKTVQINKVLIFMCLALSLNSVGSNGSEYQS